MSNSAAKGLAYAQAHPTRDGGTWSQWCMSFVNRCLDLTAAGSAWDAYYKTSITGVDPELAPIGALHWWTNPKSRSGHVAFSMGGSDCVMTDAYWPDQWKGFNTVGRTTVERYALKKTSYVYRGWSTNMARQALILGSGAPAATGEPLPVRKLPKMFSFIRKASGGIKIIDPATGYARVLGATEWAGYAANGCAFANVADAAWDAVPVRPATVTPPPATTPAPVTPAAPLSYVFTGKVEPVLS